MMPSTAGRRVIPLSDARRALRAFVDLLEGRVPSCAEKREAGLLP